MTVMMLAMRKSYDARYEVLRRRDARLSGK